MQSEEIAIAGGYGAREEYFNVLTHGLGVILALVGGVGLVIQAWWKGDLWLVGSVIIFSITMVLLYSASTMYHWVSEPALKRRWKVLDHASIYLLIAGTYTPFTMGVLRGEWGWGLFGVIWMLAIAGVIFKLFFTGQFNVIATLLYVVMGWLIVLAAGPMMAVISETTMMLLIGGGVTYTTGVLFYLRKSMRYAHSIWHLFVLGGSTLHAAAIATI